LSSVIKIGAHFVFIGHQQLLLWLLLIAGNIRNLAMEKVAGSVLFPCRYVSNGCNATMPHTDKSSHEDGCEFRSDVFQSLTCMLVTFVSELDLINSIVLSVVLQQLVFS